MLFSEPTFLFCFLPLVLFGGLLLPGVRARNLWLLMASLCFYAFGESVVIMLQSILLNWLFGIWVGMTRGSGRQRLAITTAIATNIALLVFYKYTGFLQDNLNALGAAFGLPSLRMVIRALPIGISFLTFHGMSYVIDVYRGDAPPNKRFLDAALYLSFFPQLIAGPIIRYRDIAHQIRDRKVTIQDLAAGIQRFIMGLGKKLLIANTVGLTVDRILRLPATQVTPGMAWLAVLAYTLQIYFDFSGYSDMAIGLARMFGFRFAENFNYPYISTTLTEFWHRWHISLGSWFRDYVFFPLGGNRRGSGRTYLNLVLVLLLCGLWHGANWTFAAWGLFHGGILVLERLALARIVNGWWRPFRHGYAVVLIMAGWVVFRSPSMGAALALFRALAGQSLSSSHGYSVATYLEPGLLIALFAGALLSTPLFPALQRGLGSLCECHSGWERLLGLGIPWATLTGLLLLTLASAAALAAGTYSPFIYYKF